MQQRYYDPQIGRFLSVDPVSPDANSGTNFNRYNYANNNPYRFTDPDGRYSLDQLKADWASIKKGGNSGLEAAAFEEGGGAGKQGSALGEVAYAVTFIAIVGSGDVVQDMQHHGVSTKSLASTPYKRPSNATTPAQRQSVQGKPCVKCGAETPKQIASHKTALVKEHHETGTIDKAKMRSVEAIQSECPTCSNREGAEMSRYSRDMNKKLNDGK